MTIGERSSNLVAVQLDWPLGTLVRKKSGSSWNGRIVGYYSTDLTPHGVAIESNTEVGSVQIYPIKAIEIVHGDPS